MLWNPFRRVTYRYRTILPPEECGKHPLAAMSDFNDAARTRYLKATAFGDHFTALIEPLSLGPRGSGRLMSYFVVEALGRYAPARDGSVEVTIGFKRSVSLFQIAWRLLFVAVLVFVAWGTTSVGVISSRGIGVAVILAVVVLPWSALAYVQGMRQAARDWAALTRFVPDALGSHASERL